LAAMAGELATAQMTEGKRTGQQIGRDGMAAEEFKLALADAGRLGAFGIGATHLIVILQQDKQKSKRMFGMRK
jgi:hypothetical protein